MATQTVVATLQAHATHHPWPEDKDGWRDALQSAFSLAREALDTEACRCQQPVQDFATTLMLVVATSHLVAAAQIGDGAAIVADNVGNILALTEPQHGEFVNETRFLTSDNMLASMQVQVWQGHPRHLALFTDGLERLILSRPANTPYGPFFHPLFRFTADLVEATAGQESLTRLLRSDRIRARSDDDLTLLLAAYTEG
jgi:serine/threonine protein phosphatase PrpC